MQPCHSTGFYFLSSSKFLYRDQIKSRHLDIGLENQQMRCTIPYTIMFIIMNVEKRATQHMSGFSVRFGWLDIKTLPWQINEAGDSPGWTRDVKNTSFFSRSWLRWSGVDRGQKRQKQLVKLVSKSDKRGQSSPREAWLKHTTLTCQSQMHESNINPQNIQPAQSIIHLYGSESAGYRCDPSL